MLCDQRLKVSIVVVVVVVAWFVRFVVDLFECVATMDVVSTLTTTQIATLMHCRM